MGTLIMWLDCQKSLLVRQQSSHNYKYAGLFSGCIYEKWMDYAEVSFFPAMFPSLKANGPEFVIRCLRRVVSDCKYDILIFLIYIRDIPPLAVLSALSKKL